MDLTVTMEINMHAYAIAGEWVRHLTAEPKRQPTFRNTFVGDILD